MAQKMTGGKNKRNIKDFIWATIIISLVSFAVGAKLGQQLTIKACYENNLGK